MMLFRAFDRRAAAPAFVARRRICRVLLLLATLVIILSIALSSSGQATALQRPAVAIAVSGAARGPLVLRRFANGLVQHVVRPATAFAFDTFLWLQDDEAEEEGSSEDSDDDAEEVEEGVASTAP